MIDRQCSRVPSMPVTGQSANDAVQVGSLRCGAWCRIDPM